ncbi:cyclic nucleotide-binding/CBS domain-containing protein [Ideonella sp.]|uniref:CBS domain-containing protein n=1 Tax=Ideonella sp. TaxID=1929293 RepID=UPI0035B03942
MSRLISSLMQPRVWSIDMDDTISEVERQFAEQGLTWAPVLESKRTIVGVISAADLLQFHAQERDPARVAAWQLCSYKPISVDEHTPLAEVARQMTEQGIHHVVVTRGECIAGVVSSMDFVRTFVDAG